jgi:cytochrome P450
MASAATAGPPARFFTGHLTDFSADPLGFLTRTAREYGALVPYRFLGNPAYLVNSPEVIDSLLNPRYREFIKTIGLRTRLMRRLLGRGLVTSEGEFWVRQRRLAQPAFHRQRVAGYAAVMVAYTERLIGSWTPGDTRDIHADMMRLTLEIVAKTLFDAEIAGEAAEAGAALERLMEQFPASQWTLAAFIDGIIPTPGGIRARQAIRRLEQIVLRTIAQRRESGKDRGDLLSMLLQARDEDGSRMSDRQLRDEVLTFLFAGHETTALALTWAWYLLSQHLEAEATLRAELSAELGGRAPTIDDLPRLRYAEQVIKEAMRLYPPVWTIGRETTAACEIAGCQVPKGAQLMLSQWVTHRDPRYWEEPEQFRPGRWADDAAPPRGAYFPFGSGPRGCIGQAFALMEAVLILATIAQRFRLALAPGCLVEPWPTATLRPRHGLRMITMEEALRPTEPTARPAAVTEGGEGSPGCSAAN